MLHPLGRIAIDVPKPAATALPDSGLKTGTVFHTFAQQRHLAQHPAPSQALVPQEAQGIDWKRLALSGVFLMSGLLMKSLPAYHDKRFSMPTDWKIYGKVIMGVLAAGQFNKALHWKPAPWIGALETVAVIHPLTTPVMSLASLGQLLVLAPWVSGVVQTASSLNKRLGDTLESWHIPKVLTQFAISTALLVGGVRLFPPLYKFISSRGLLGPLGKESLTDMAATAAAGNLTCIRGCTPGGVICLSEVGEMLGGLGQWWRSHSPRPSQEERRTFA